MKLLIKVILSMTDADPDYVRSDKDGSDPEDSVSEDDEEILDREVGDHVLYVYRDLPKYVSGRLRTKEFGPGYPWWTEDPQTNVRKSMNTSPKYCSGSPTRFKITSKKIRTESI